MILTDIYYYHDNKKETQGSHTLGLQKKNI